MFCARAFCIVNDLPLWLNRFHALHATAEYTRSVALLHRDVGGSATPQRFQHVQYEVSPADNETDHRLAGYSHDPNRTKQSTPLEGRELGAVDAISYHPCSFVEHIVPGSHSSATVDLWIGRCTRKGSKSRNVTGFIPRGRLGQAGFLGSITERHPSAVFNWLRGSARREQSLARVMSCIQFQFRAECSHWNPSFPSSFVPNILSH